MIKGFSGLSLEQSPPFRLPLRFFLSAVLFGMAGGVLLLVLGPEALASRWNPGTMALVHVFTLGFITMVMCGAILQMLPVLGGVPVPGILAVGPAVHGLLSLGTLSLVGGFLSGYALAFDAAVITLGGGILLFLGAVTLGLWRVGSSNHTIRAIRSAALALFVTLLLGVYLVAMLAGYGSSPHMLQATDLHVGWALVGWLGLLLMGVAFRMIPMFQATPEYPGWLVRGSLPLLLLLLALWSWAVLTGSDPGRMLTEGAMAGVFGLFAALTLWLQRAGRRRGDRAHRRYWQSTAAAIGFAVLLWGLLGLPAAGAWNWPPVLWGWTLLGGVAVSAISGMLYKIVPFLAWFHLQQRQMALGSPGGLKIPHMHELLPPGPVRRQLRLHLAVLVFGAAAIGFPDPLARPLGLLMLLSFGLLGHNLLRAVRSYRRSSAELARYAAHNGT